MAYKFETRMISARLLTESFERCARHGITINAAANYGLDVLIKAHQRKMLWVLGFNSGFFGYRDRVPAGPMRPTTLRIRHDYLDYIEMIGLNRNKMLNYAVVHVCSMIENGEIFASAVSDGPQGRGIARRNVYTNSSTTGEEGREK